MTEIERIAKWLRRRIDMQWQCANALPYTPGNLITHFSPERLADQCAMQATLLDHLLASPDSKYALHGVKVMAWAYRMCPDYDEKWLPDNGKGTGS